MNSNMVMIMPTKMMMLAAVCVDSLPAPASALFSSLSKATLALLPIQLLSEYITEWENLRKNFPPYHVME